MPGPRPPRIRPALGDAIGFGHQRSAGAFTTRWRPPPKRRWGTVSVLLGALILSACSNSSASRPKQVPPSISTTTTTTATQPVPTYLKLGKPTWIISYAAITLLHEFGLSNSLVDYFFNNPDTFVIQSEGVNVHRKLPRAIPGENFTSYAAMRHAFSSHTIFPGTRAILYDDEAWRFTPPAESRHPATYAARAAVLAHRFGMSLIFTPATDLATGGSTGSAGGLTSYQRYLAQGLASQGARVSDVFEIQAQAAEATPAFVPFVTLATAQARAANPHALVLAGIGTNPVGRPVTTAQLLTAYRLTRATVQGYWFNVPQTGPKCSLCGTGQPYVAVAFFRSLASLLARAHS